MIQTLFGSLEEEKKTGFLDRMKQAVTRTRENLTERIEEVVSFGKEIDRNTLDDLEATLIGADLGSTTTQEVLGKLRHVAAVDDDQGGPQFSEFFLDGVMQLRLVQRRH